MRNEKFKVHPLDFVRTPKGGLAIVTEIGPEGDASIEYVGGMNPGHEHNAWWEPEELMVIDSLPMLLARSTCHPFGRGKEQLSEVFGITPDAAKSPSTHTPAIGS